MTIYAADEGGGMEQIMGRAKLFLAFNAFVAAFFVLIVLTIGPSAAYAIGSEDVYNAFTKKELSELFEKCSKENAQFVACNYDDNGRSVETYYLKVRDKYSARYETLVGDDQVDLAVSSDEGIDPQVMIEDRPLEPISIDEIGDSPWNKVLYLMGASYYEIDDNTYGYRGSGFLVSENLGITAAHCVFPTKNFATSFYGYTSITSEDKLYDENQNPAGKTLRTAIVKIEWADSAVERMSIDSSGEAKPTCDHDTDYDFALLIFDEGFSNKGSFFSYDSVTMLEGLTLDLNLAGYPGYYGGHWQYRLYKNLEDGKIGAGSLSSGNIFRMFLSSKPGMSGGPVYTVKDGKYVAIGVMSTGYRYNSEEDPSDDDTYGDNYACRITESMQVWVVWANEEGFSNITPAPSTPSSPFTGIDDLTFEEVGEQMADQRVIQRTKLEDVQEKLIEMNAENPDIQAWIYFPNTYTDTPLLSTPVAFNSHEVGFYLDHNRKAEDSLLGCVYMERDESIDFDQPITILYGHSFSNENVMFTKLHAFDYADFFIKHECFYILTLDHIYAYRIMEASDYTSSHLYSLIDESNPESVQTYFDIFASTDTNFSGYRRTFALDASTDKMVVLSTCTIPATSRSRFVVCGVLAGVSEI